MAFLISIPVELVKKLSLDPDTDTFDHKLSFSQATKNPIKDLVVNHEKGKEQSGLTLETSLNGFIGVKGRGLVMLFHVPPRVGKILTGRSFSVSSFHTLLKFVDSSPETQ